MKKKITLVFILLALLVGTILYMDATLIAPTRLKVRYETIVDESFADSFENVTICYFSDLHFDTLTDEKRFEEVVEQINSLSADIVIFGGDLFDDTYTKYPNSTTQQKAIALLSSIEAPLGKYTVLGDWDCLNDLIQKAITNIFTKSQFEILDNSCIKIHNKGIDTLSLIGINSSYPKISTAYETVSPNDFSIVIAHNPEIATDLATKGSKLMLAGHTMGNQINLPFYRMEINTEQQYLKGKYEVGSLSLDVTTGVGLQEIAARLFCDAEIVLYRLTSH